MKNPLYQLYSDVNGETYQIINNQLVNVRLEAAEKYAWGIPNEEAIEELVMHQPIIEIGAGLGYWAKLTKDFSKNKITYLSFDKIPPTRKESHSTVALYDKNILKALHSSYTLFMCWVPEQEALDIISNYNNRKLIWVGEPLDFPGFKEEKVIEIPSWKGFNDNFYVLRRKDD